MLNFTLRVVPRLKLTSVRLPWSEVIPALEGHVLNHRNYLKITLVSWGGEARPFQLSSWAGEIYCVMIKGLEWYGQASYDNSTFSETFTYSLFF